MEDASNSAMSLKEKNDMLKSQILRKRHQVKSQVSKL